jgi:ABC-2 type transport system permease protein
MNTRNIYEIFRYELWRNLQRKGFLFTTFGLPLLVLVLMLGYNFISTQSADEEQEQQDQLEDLFDFEGIQTAGFVDNSGLFSTVPEPLQARMLPYVDIEAARAALQAAEIDVFYVIPADYPDNTTVRMHQPGFSVALNAAPMQQLAYLVLAPELEPTQIARLRNPAQFQEFNLLRQGDTDGQAQNEDADIFGIQLFAFVFIMGVFFTNGYLMQSVIQEKENRLIEVLISSVSPFDLLAGKILGVGLLGLFQILVWGVAIVLLLNVAGTLEAFATLATFTGLQLPVGVLPLMLMYYVLGYLLIAAVFAGIGALSNSMREGPQFAGLIVFPVIIPFYFFSLFLETPGAALPIGLSIFPITAPLSMIMRLTLSSVPPLEVIISLALLALSVVGMMWMAARLFRVQTLLAGQVPKLREIPGLIFGSS